MRCILSHQVCSVSAVRADRVVSFGELLLVLQITTGVLRVAVRLVSAFHVASPADARATTGCAGRRPRARRPPRLAARRWRSRRSTSVEWNQGTRRGQQSQPFPLARPAPPRVPPPPALPPPADPIGSESASVGGVRPGWRPGVPRTMPWPMRGTPARPTKRSSAAAPTGDASSHSASGGRMNQIRWRPHARRWRRWCMPRAEARSRRAASLHPRSIIEISRSPTRDRPRYRDLEFTLYIYINSSSLREWFNGHRRN